MRETPSKLFSNKFLNGNGIVPQKMSERSEQWGGIYESERNIKDRAINNYEKYGTRKFISEGTLARLNSIPFNIPENIVGEGDIISFNYGYYERGTRLIEILIREGQVKTGNVEITPENFEIELRKIAINDGMNPEMDFDSLPEIIRFNTIYAVGFVEGELLAPSKKSRR